MSLFLSPSYSPPSADIPIELTSEQLKELNILSRYVIFFYNKPGYEEYEKLTQEEKLKIALEWHNSEWDKKKEDRMDTNRLSDSEKKKLAEDMVTPVKNCRGDFSNREKQPKIIMKQRAVGMSTMTEEQLQELASKVSNMTKETIELTSEQLQARKEALHQEKMRQRRVRKSIKNKALSVAKSKHDRRRIARGASAQQISSKENVNDDSRARTLRREAARNMERLSRKFSTKKVETITESSTPVSQSE